MRQQEEHVSLRERHNQENPEWWIEHRGLWIRQPRLSRCVVRIPKREAEVAQLDRSEIAQRLEVIAVIAEGEHFTAHERPGEHRQRQQHDEGERSAAGHREAQKSRTIRRVSRTP